MRLLATLSAVVLTGLVSAKTFDLHSHTCMKCRNTWYHFGTFARSPSSHTCSNCGTKQFWKGKLPSNRMELQMIKQINHRIAA